MIVGIVGLGRMGSAMAQRLREQGFEVVGWDQNTAASKNVAGLRVAANAKAVAAAAEIVISSITEDHGARRISR